MRGSHHLNELTNAEFKILQKEKASIHVDN